MGCLVHARRHGWPAARKCSARPPEHQRNVRIRKRVLDIIPPGDTDLQRRMKAELAALEGGDVSVPRRERADRSAQLKAHFGGRGGVCRATGHVAGDLNVRQRDVMGVSTCTALRRVEDTCCGSIIGHRHIR